MPEGLREDPYHWTELPSLNKDYYYYYYHYYYCYPHAPPNPLSSHFLPLPLLVLPLISPFSLLLIFCHLLYPAPLIILSSPFLPLPLLNPPLLLPLRRTSHSPLTPPHPFSSSSSSAVELPTPISSKGTRCLCHRKHFMTIDFPTGRSIHFLLMSHSSCYLQTKSPPFCLRWEIPFTRRKAVIKVLHHPVPAKSARLLKKTLFKGSLEVY